MENIVSQQPIKASGSTRRYVRETLSDGSTVIRVDGTSLRENEAFIYLAGHFRSAGLNVPEVLDVSSDGMTYRQEDLGDVSLWDAVAAGRASGEYSPEERSLLVKAVRALPSFQMCSGIDYSHCYPEAEFGAQTVDFDLNYFKYCCLKPSGVEFDEVALHRDFETLKSRLLSGGVSGFMYRDFQTRNVMLRDGEPWLIDFQGGRKGPVLYDLASFVWQARSHFPSDLKDELVEAYASAMSAYAPMTALEIKSGLYPFALFRMLQTFGAYGFRGLIQLRPHFLSSIPLAVAQMREFLSSEGFALSGLGECPTLSAALKAMVSFSSLAGSSAAVSSSLAEIQEASSLSVEVLSFSYRKGLPADASGNGGGFIFDCRSIHNPGRYDQYKSLTGRDESVARFLEEDGEVFSFLESAYRLSDAHVEKFLKRGFSNMQVAFGCTGGQHRSVYCAERMAEHLRSKYGVNVILKHMESPSWPKR